MAQVGRISGPLLTANLERNGIDLAFSNTLNDTQLLYLDVINNKIGVNKNSPSQGLDVSGKLKSLGLLSSTATVANFDIDSNNINSISGNIFFDAGDSIRISNFETDNIRISDNKISTYRSNSNIEFSPNGTGTVDILSSLNVAGNIHATGNITIEGSIVFGDAADDSTSLTDIVTFNSDINSDLIPLFNNSVSLGTADKQWDKMFTVLVNGSSVTANQVTIADESLANRTGNIFYVSEKGNDTNVGDHPQGPFKTIKHALSVADASTGGPVTVYIFAGGYEEECPLVVPSNVTVIGQDMRNTIIRPDSAYQSEDIFYLNGESTVQNLTIKDFYYDSVNDTGYAFRFAPNTIVSTRSPYIQDVTVITQGTTTSVSDPRGFASGDAGKGALVDGASVNSASQEASMLFHSVTFITPGVDAITMTNGVRVEWLNSFTYFANRGLYAFDGVTGHLSTDGSTIKYGAEIRSIGSANVYGNFGAVADGADCLMYLIKHNFAYIGVGKFVDNDPSRVIQSQEATELNSGRIFFQSIDHLGNFRIGNEFFVDQELGETTLELSEGDIDSLSGLRITTNNQTTIIDGDNIDIGNLLLQGNTISTIAGSLNVASTGTIIFQDETFIQKNLAVTGDFSVGGSLITFGNQATDTINFNTPFDQNLEPDISGLYNLGSPLKKWAKAWLSEAQISDIKFKDNVIATTASNADLELRANGIGKIYLPNNNLNITNNFAVSETTDLNSVSITGFLNHTGLLLHTGNNDNINFFISQNLTTGSQITLEKIFIDGNIITTTETNEDLELRANSTGKVLVPNNNVDISNNLDVRTIFVSDINLTSNTISLDDIIASGQIRMFDNVITTTLSNADLELRANGTGIKKLQDFNFYLDTLYTTSNNITLVANQNLNITSTASIQIPKGTTAQRTLSAEHIRFNTTNNVFEGQGTLGILSFGGIYSSNRQTSVLADKNNNTIDISVAGTLVGEVNSGGLEIHGLQVDDISFQNSTITTNVTNSNLELRRDGAGRVIIDEVEIVDRHIYNESTTDLTFDFTADGYAKITGTYGVAIPNGNDSSRSVSPQIGETRYNTERELLETYDGTEWIASAGGGSVVTLDFMEDLSSEWSLILG